MNIQENLNQATSVASILAMNNPAVMKIGEKLRLKQKTGIVKKKVEAMKSVGAGAKSFNDYVQAAEDLVDVRNELFEIDPSAKNYEAKLKTIETKDEIVKTVKDYEQQMAKKAEASLTKKQEQKRKHRDFLKYMKDEPYTLGEHTGTIGSLNPEQQKVIANSYTRAEKTKIMNDLDERRKNG